MDIESKRKADASIEAAAATTIAMHRVTGSFTDRSHESAFAAQLFRVGFPCHLLLISIILGPSIYIVLVATWHAPLAQYAWSAIALGSALGLVFRVLLHCTHDPVRAQWWGARAWTTLLGVPCLVSIGIYLANSADACENESQETRHPQPPNPTQPCPSPNPNPNPTPNPNPSPNPSPNPNPKPNPNPN